MNIKLLELKLKLAKYRSIYNLSANLYGILYQYEWDKSDTIAEQLKKIVKMIEIELPLPSGRIGTVLAFALEMQMYNGAALIIKNAKELGIDLKSLSTIDGNSDTWDLKTTIEFSKPKEIKNPDLEKNRALFHNFLTLHQTLTKYAIHPNEQDTKALKDIVTSIPGSLPLPSGRVGNTLAFALEVQEYTAALFIINHAQELHIDLTSISSTKDGKNIFNAKETFNLSQLGFKTTKISKKDQSYQNYPWLIQYINNNIDAAIELIFTLPEKLEETKKRTK